MRSGHDVSALPLLSCESLYNIKGHPLRRAEAATAALVPGRRRTRPARFIRPTLAWRPQGQTCAGREGSCQNYISSIVRAASGKPRAGHSGGPQPALAHRVADAQHQ